MGNIQSHELHDYPQSTTTSYNDERPCPITYHQARGEDPFLILLKGFNQIYMQGKEVIERLFPGACDELLDFLNKIELTELVPRMKNQPCSNTMKRSLSMSSIVNNEWFKVRGFDVDVDVVIPPDGDQKPVQQGDGHGQPK